MRTLPRCLHKVSELAAAVIALMLYGAAGWELFDLGMFTLETGETIDGVGALYPWLILLTVPGLIGQVVLMGCQCLLIFLPEPNTHGGHTQC